MKRRRDAFKILTGMDKKTAFHFPSREDSIDRLLKEAKSNYDLRLLGIGEKEVWISEEERSVNFHIIGAPGEGKSRFLEYNIRKDIDAGLGACLLDPSEGGDTVKHILSYCESIGFKKIILIDPNTISKYDKIPVINTLNRKDIKDSVAGVMETLSILFGVKTTDTPRIRRYLPALLRILTTANLSLTDSKYFASYNSFGYREAIFEKIYGDQKDVQTIKDAFKSEFVWQNYFSSTINRLDTLWEEPLSQIFGSTEGINFIEAVSQGWLILVNLSPYRLNNEEARILGITVISQIIQAVNTLVNNNWKGVYYLYMDEAGRFATPQIDEVLTYKRKSGLRLILAHHGFDQFEDHKVLSAILNGARIKIMFDTPNHDDRLKMMKALGYGGDLPPALAAFANQNIPKQYAVIRKAKETPVRIRLPEVSDTKPVSEAFLQEILSQPFYKSKQQIKDESNARLVPSYSKRPEHREAPYSKATGSDPVPRGSGGGVRKSVPTDSKKPQIPKNEKPFKF